MPILIAIPWIIFAGVIGAIIFFNFIVVKYLSDNVLGKHFDESKFRRLPTIVTTLGLSLSMLALLLIPVDIYSVSSQADLSESGISDVGSAIKSLYYILYSLMLLFIFVIIPFTYFFYEEAGDGVTMKARVWAGMKYTTFLIILVVIVFIVGLFVKGGSPDTNEDYKDYVDNVLDKENKGDSAMLMALACATAVSYVFFLIYTGFGLSVFPLDWIKGARSYQSENKEVDLEIEKAKTTQKDIHSKYLGGQHKDKKDSATLRLLETKERTLAHRREKLLESRKGCWKNFLVLLRPFYLLFGILFLIVTLIIVISIVITMIDRSTHSPCGIKCGFVLDDPKKWNPIDTFLTIIAKTFPIDYVVFGAIIFYMYFATLGGLEFIGIRVLWIRLFRVKPHRTLPQGLLIGCVVLMFSLLAINMELMTLTPQYVNFGSQKYTNSAGDEVSCDLKAPTDKCHMTQIGLLFNRISMKLPFFGVLYYFASWALIGVFVLGLIFAIFKKRGSNTGDDDEDEDDWDF